MAEAVAKVSDFVPRIGFVGDSCSGKTSLTTVLYENKYAGDYSSNPASIGVDFKKVKCNVDGEMVRWHFSEFAFVITPTFPGSGPAV